MTIAASGPFKYGCSSTTVAQKGVGLGSLGYNCPEGGGTKLRIKGMQHQHSNSSSNHPCPPLLPGFSVFPES